MSHSLYIHPLKLLIAQGEGQTLDFKKTISSARKIAKTLCAFANTQGGRLLVGVNDNGNVSGTQPEEDGYMIESAARVFCRPAVPYELFYHDLNGKQVLEVVVPQSTTKPHTALGEDEKWWVYIRVKDQSLLASKVVVDVLRREQQGQNTLIQYGSKEQALLDYLNTHDRITLKEFCKLLNISRWRATRILVDLVSAGVVRVHTHEKTEFYTLA